jgi:hypothetical protein
VERIVIAPMGCFFEHDRVGFKVGRCREGEHFRPPVIRKGRLRRTRLTR